jgi:hypothetical protein
MALNKTLAAVYTKVIIDMYKTGILSGSIPVRFIPDSVNGTAGSACILQYVTSVSTVATPVFPVRVSQPVTA